MLSDSVSAGPRAGIYSSAPIPLLPVKHRRSTGLNVSGDLPCDDSHALITELPNLSGRLSASRPGRPWKLSRANPGNRYMPGKRGITTGDTSIPERRKAKSYSNAPVPVSSSNTTVPILVFQSITSAAVTAHLPISILSARCRVVFCSEPAHASSRAQRSETGGCLHPG